MLMPTVLFMMSVISQVAGLQDLARRDVRRTRTSPGYPHYDNGIDFGGDSHKTESHTGWLIRPEFVKAEARTTNKSNLLPDVSATFIIKTNNILVVK